MPDFVRVKHPLFGEYSVRIATPDVEVIDKPAVDHNGDPLPAKPLTTVATEAAAKKNHNGGESVNKSKEDSK